ncbi:uncharacterized protein PHALS_09568 [Plasmopara halstedii]|uniref:Uncharacterized protein n=1 Tax=Plasmopara halstedii TaxID=4781 RepID=A0A0P1A5P9_PLAHL|nr:uncharacterized protein PHALS_09568 [Plasmopara halstedii]CEG35447.1 hypothetical protein PHALS_09568 [Plasmopara halstedii]|eukprot:XP_024571816.1 hypothetical protein PHALS_09568 [Plasmopara halstedii]
MRAYRSNVIFSIQGDARNKFIMCMRESCAITKKSDQLGVARWAEDSASKNIDADSAFS